MSDEKDQKTEKNTNAQTKPATKKKVVSRVEFAREQGVQVKFPDGKFLKSIHKVDPAKLGPSAVNDSQFHIVGIKDVIVSQIGLTIVLNDDSEKTYPYSSIASFTVVNE